MKILKAKLSVKLSLTPPGFLTLLLNLESTECEVCMEHASCRGGKCECDKGWTGSGNSCGGIS